METLFIREMFLNLAANAKSNDTFTPIMVFVQTTLSIATPRSYYGTAGANSFCDVVNAQFPTHLTLTKSKQVHPFQFRRKGYPTINGN